jgi:hypothetical protein
MFLGGFFEKVISQKEQKLRKKYLGAHKESSTLLIHFFIGLQNGYPSYETIPFTNM